MAFSVEGKSVMVTGAARGVGLAISRKFAQGGARVMMNGTDEERLKKEAERLRQEGHQAQFFAGDVKERLTVTNLISATVDAHDRIDILVNASRDVRSADPLDQQDETFTYLMETNVAATLRISRAVAARMIEQADGSEEPAGAIVNVTSIAARRTLPELLAYSVASAALDQLTRSLAVALAAHRIRVNAIALGSVMSQSLQSALKEREGLLEELTAVTPLGRVGEADEAADAALFLVSDSASFVTGQILAVDGGRTNLDPLDTPAH